uniref:Microtubule-associated protein 7a n=1 Tax=Sparus aurata TaxID=8175 RepID=A0A671WA79_SPAAU
MLPPRQVSHTGNQGNNYTKTYYTTVYFCLHQSLWSHLSCCLTLVCVADSLIFNKIDERQRLARERRGEREKQNAIKEAQWQAREERARQHYEKQLEEKKRKLEEQRVKEDKRRAAVEEKRRQKMEEDKARHEAVMRRTLERSQRTRQKPNRWSWGGALNTNTPSTPADSDRRSVSTMNLSKHTDPIITKRLSSSSATLLHSPDRGLRRLPLTPWESNVVNRLQQPTHSYLARSRSAMSLSGEQTGNTHTSHMEDPLGSCGQQRNISSPPAYKPSAGTTDPEEASRILAENRRLAREQREREEEERRQQEEQARYKEEEESRQKEEAERLRQEREKHFQKEEAERLERKKRLEEIMKRTRRSDTAEKVTSFPSYVLRENGEFEEVIELPSHSRLTPPEGEEEHHEEEERVPVVAFRENGLLKPLSGIEDISAQQGPGQ